MILRYNILLGLPFLLSLSQSLLFARAQTFDCKPTLKGRLFDFTDLLATGDPAQEHVVNRTRETPPTKTVDSLAFNLCDDLKAKEALGEQDQCPKGTRVCLTQVNIRENEPERIVSVISLAQSSKLEPNVTFLSDESPQYLTLLFHGSSYPGESTPSTAQSFNLTLWCDPQRDKSNITFAIESYDGSQLKMTYTGPAGCPRSAGDGDSGGDNKGPNDGKEEPVGSGMGWFFLLLLLAFVAYFAIGAYYNYSTYGARGLDLLPHRDFWQEVPYMLKDVVSHMCSSARPRRSARGGYIAV